jgi:hypothetical protein
VTTTERAAQVWRGYDALAQATTRPGTNYSPGALMVLRWLAFRPGSTVDLIHRVQCRRTWHVEKNLRRLRALDLAHATTGGRWWLTEHGRELVVLIDEEGIV